MHKGIKKARVILLTIATLMLTRDAFSQLAPVWSKRFGLQDDGRTPGDYPADAFLGSPALGSDGTVYIAGSLPDPNHNNERRLYALNGSSGVMLTGWPVYLGTRALSSSGTAKDVGIESTAAIGSDGMLYIGSWNYKIYKINPSSPTTAPVTYTLTGSLQGILRNAPILANGYLYCWVNRDPTNSSSHSHVVILNPSNMTLVGSWLDTAVYGDAIASPALGRDQMLYVCTMYVNGSSDLTAEKTGHIYAVDVSDPAHPSTSTARSWAYPSGCIGPIVSSPVIGADGRLYVSTQPGQMFDNSVPPNIVPHDPSVICFDPSSTTPGVPIWSRTTGGDRSIDGTPAIGRIGDLYIPNDGGGSIDTSVSAMNPRDQVNNGDYTFDWDAPVNSEKFDASPAVAFDEIVWAKSVHPGSTAATLRKIGLDGIEILSAATSVGRDTACWHGYPWDLGITAVFSSPAIAANGKLYVATAGDAHVENNNNVPDGNGDISCFNTGTTSPAFWPNYRGNQFNSGNVQDNRWTTNTVANMSASIAALSTYPATGESKPYSANNVTNIVGYFPYSGHFAACNWTSAPSFPNQMSSFNGMGFYYTYIASGLNDLSNTVGSQIVLNGSVYNFRAIYWDTLTSTPTELARPTGFTDAEAFEISNTGVIVGTGTNSSAKSHALRWTDKTATTGIDLNTLNDQVPTLKSFGYGVNAHGWAVGKSQAFANGNLSFHGFATPPNRSISQFDNLSPNGNQDGPASEAHSINGVGQIVGTSETFPSVPTHAYVWYVNGDGTILHKDLGTLGGATSGAFSINNRGQVVGWSYKTDGTIASFIWVPGWTAMHDLKTFLSPTDQSSWTELTAATGITDDGIVVGYGKRTGTSYYNGFVIKVKP